MKTTPLVLLAVAVLTPASLFAVRVKDVPRAEVNFFEPTKFTDVKDSFGGDHERTTYLEQIREHIFQQVRHYVPEGHKLAVTITDIDMAGDFEPWRGFRWDDIRVVKDIYPPRIDLAFQLTDAQGNVVKEGKRSLRDLAFMMKLSGVSQNDAVRHEKALLDDWLRAEFPRIRKDNKS